jgi:uncharacterized protein YdiU (UPF0061 family)
MMLSTTPPSHTHANIQTNTSTSLTHADLHITPLPTHPRCAFDGARGLHTDDWLRSMGPTEDAVVDENGVALHTQHTAIAVRAASPQPFSTSHPRMVIVEPSVAASLGLSAEWMASAEAVDVFGERTRFCGTTAFHHNYGGHQFGAWGGQLGDGRAITLGILSPSNQSKEGSELLSPFNQSKEGTGATLPLEIAVKGSGKSPFSRRGDGRAVLQSNLREFLGSAALFALGVPTVRSLCVIAANVEFDGVIRDEHYQGKPRRVAAGTVTRVAPSFVR